VGVTRSQQGAQDAAGEAVVDDQGIVHVLAMEAVEEGHLLIAVGWVVGGVKLNDQHRRAPDVGDESLDQQVVEGAVLGGGDRVFEA
jgi:hypothetical protein